MNIRQIGRVSTFFIMAAVGWASASAQTIPPVSISIHAGYGGGGAPARLEEFLRASGMDDKPLVNSGFFGATPHNPNTDVGPEIGGDVRVRLRPRITVGLNASKSSAGSSYAYHYGSFLNQITFEADYAVRSVATMINWHPTPRLRVGAGPALHHVTFNNPAAGVAIRESMFGWTTGAGFAFLNRERVFSEITADYRGMGSINVDPVTLTNSLPFPGAPLETVNLTATKLSGSR